MPCPLGTFSLAGQSYCVLCAAGSYAPLTGLSVCLACNFSTPAGSSACASSYPLYAIVIYTYAPYTFRKISLASSAVTTLTAAAARVDGFAMVGSELHYSQASLNAIRKYDVVLATDALVTGVSGAAGAMVDGVVGTGKFNSPYGLAMSPDGTYMLVCDYSNHAIRKVMMSTGAISTIAGSLVGVVGQADGAGTNIRFNGPSHVAISNNGKFALVTETAGNRLRKLDLTVIPVTSTLVGGDNSAAAGGAADTDGIGTASRFDVPTTVCISSDDYWAFVAETGRHKLRMVAIPTSYVTTIISSGISYPIGLVASPFRDYLLIANHGTHQIFKLAFPMGGMGFTVGALTNYAGTGSSGSADNEVGTSATFQNTGEMVMWACHGVKGFGAVTADLQCAQCLPGTFSVGTGLCKPCAGGQYNPAYGASACLACTGNTFSGPNATACTPCPLGSTTANGFTKCTAQAGYYFPLTNLARSCGGAACPTTYKSVYTQSSPHPSSDATDGSASTYYHSEFGQVTGQWLGINFGGVKSVLGGQVFARADGFADRVNDFQIWVGNTSLATGTNWNNTDLQLCFTDVLHTQGLVSGGNQIFTCSRPLSGQYVYLMRPSVDSLNLAEILLYENAVFACPAGTYSNGAGNLLAESCLACPAGSYSSSPGLSNGFDCATCPAGTFSTGSAQSSSASCVNCGSGKYSTSGSSRCDLCAAGTYSAALALSPITTNLARNCNGGACVTREHDYGATAGIISSSYCNDGLLNECNTKCSAGNWNEQMWWYVDFGFPRSVQGGTVWATQCQIADPFRYQRTRNFDIWVGNNTQGNYFNAYGLIRCFTDTTYYQERNMTIGQSFACSPALVGRYAYVNRPGLSNNFFQASEIAFYSYTCPACPAGTYAAIEGATACTPCAGDSYSSAKSTSCSQCRPGTFSSNGSLPCAACPLGTFSAAGQTICGSCAEGYFGNTTGQSTCLKCDYNTPIASAVCSSSYPLYALIADTNADRSIRKLSLTTAEVTTIIAAPPYWAGGLVVSGDALYYAVTQRHTVNYFNLVRKGASTVAWGIDGSVGAVDTRVGTPSLNSPAGAAVSPDGAYFLMVSSHTIRKVVIATGEVSTIAGSLTAGMADGAGTNIQFNSPAGIAISNDGTFALVTEYWGNRVRRLNLMVNPVTSTLVGGDNSQSAGAQAVSWGTGSASRFSHPIGICISSDNYWAFVANTDGGAISVIILPHRLTFIFLAAGTISMPSGILASPYRDYLLVAGAGNNKIWKIPFAMGGMGLSGGTPVVFAGTGTGSEIDGTATATFNYPDAMILWSCSVKGYGAVTAERQCAQCPPGTFSVGTGVCKPCAGGQYNLVYGSSACLACAGNTFSGPNASACTPCPMGSVTAKSFTVCTLQQGYYTSMTNLARSCGGGACPTTYSTQYNAANQGLAANDGSYTTYYHSACAQTTAQWWGVNFGSVKSVWGGQVFGRSDGNADRVNDFQIWVGNASLATGATWNQAGLALCFTDFLHTQGYLQGGNQSFVCSYPVSGQYAYLMRPSTDCLNLAEILLFENVVTACPVGTSNPGPGVAIAEFCTLCAAGYYSPSGNAPCTICPPNTNSVPGSWSCAVKAGYFSASLAARFPSSALGAMSAIIGGDNFTVTHSSAFASSEGWRIMGAAGTADEWTTATASYAADGSYTGGYVTTVDGVAYAGEWVQLEMSNAHSFSSFGVQAHKSVPSRSPQSFLLAASGDGLTWHTVDSRTGLGGWSASTVKWFFGGSVVTAKYLRFIVLTTVGGDFYGSINKLYLYEAAPSQCGAGTYSLPAATACSTCPASTTSTAGSWKCTPLAGYYSGITGSRFPSVALGSPNAMVAGEAFTVTQSSFAPGYPAYNPFEANDNSDSVWLSGSPAYSGVNNAYVGTLASTVVEGTAIYGEWLQLQAANSHAFSTYTIQAQRFSANRSPASFLVVVSGDGVNWLNFDSRAGNIDWTDLQNKTFSSQSVVVAKYFRLIVLSTAAGDSYTSINKWMLYEATVTGCPAGTYWTAQGCVGCGAGTYSAGVGASSVTACAQCAAGSYSTASSTSCSPCAVGAYCPAGATASAICPLGSYCPTPSNIVSCAGGSYCPAGSTGSAQCPLGSFCSTASNIATCSVSTYCPVGSTAAAQCPAGSFCSSASNITACSLGAYCPAGSTVSTQCALGSFCPTASIITACSEGAYCPAGSTASAQCPLGYYCANASSVVSCTLGAYCPAGSTASAQCPLGSYCSTASSITACSAGAYCPAGSTVSTQCALGSFCSTASSITVCAPGAYCPAGSTVSTQCALGSFCSTASSITACSAGAYCPAGSTVSTQCPLGSFCSTASSITACSAGAYCAAGSTVSTQCPLGSYCSTGSNIAACSPGAYCPVGSSASAQCPAGSFCSTASSIAACSAGAYCAAGSTVSTQCPLGSYCSSASSITACAPGAYCPAGSTVSTQCSLGSYCSTASNIASCSGGAYCPAGSTASAQCPAGSFCSSASSITACAPGAYCPAGSTASAQCPLGSFCSTASNIASCSGGAYCPAGSTVSAQCPLGSFCSSASSITVCAPGAYCPAGSTASAQCPLGSFCSTASNITACEPSAYCPAGSTASAQCPLGSYCSTPSNIVSCVGGAYCPVGSTASAQCPAGSFCATPSNIVSCLGGAHCPAGSTASAQCAKGSYCSTAASIVECAAGSYCAEGSTASTQCPAGSFCPIASNLTACLAGNYCAPGSTASAQCPAGSYCSTPSNIVSCVGGAHCPAGSTASAQCPAGSFCSSASNIASCVGGAYCPAGSTASLQCPLGSFCSTPSNIVSCLGGAYCPAGSTASAQCPLGSYCATPANIASCVSGQYCPGGSTASMQCPEGSYCSTPSDIASCASGQHCPKGSTAASACAAGYYCPNSSVAIQCAAGSYCAAGSTASAQCPAGSYCATPSSITSCVSGSFCATASTATIECPAGSYCPTPSAIVACSVGSYCAAGSTASVACPVGSYCQSPATIANCSLGDYCPLNTSQRALCAVSFYCPNTTVQLPCAIPKDCTEGSIKQYDCDAGFYCPDNVTSIQCSAGSFCPIDATYERPCSPGSYATQKGASACTACAIGTFGTVNGSNSTQACVTCATGTYSDTEGSAQCSGCPGGTFTTLTGATICQGCEVGQYSVVSATSCIACAAGSYASAKSQATCTGCPTGTYANTTGATAITVCVVCPSGAYGALLGLSVCAACPAGGYATGSGGSVCSYCAAGLYGTGLGATSLDACAACVNGTFTASPGYSTCSKCAAGRYMTGLQATTCQSCSAGSYASGLGSFNCTACAPGAYAVSVGLAACVLCPTGRYSTSVALNTTCTACAEGTYNTALGITQCSQCAAGRYGTGLGTTVCTQCPAGRFSTGLGIFTDCQLCAEGQFSLSAATACSQCFGGTYNTGLGMPNASQCSGCAIGQYSSGLGMTTAGVCLGCAENECAHRVGMSACFACGPGLKALPLATGGQIMADVTGHNVHGFYAGTANLTVQQAVTVDILVVGGGGSGGHHLSGGGGAGALIFYSSLVLTPGTYTVTVGAGGAMQTQTQPSSAIGKPGNDGGYSSIAFPNGSSYLFLARGGGGGGGGGDSSAGTGAEYGRSGGCGGGGGNNGNMQGVSGGAALVTNILAVGQSRGNRGGAGPPATCKNNAKYPMQGGGGGGVGRPGTDSSPGPASSCNAPGPGGSGLCNITIDNITHNFAHTFGLAYTLGAEWSNGEYWVGGGGGGGGYSAAFKMIAGGVGGGGFGLQYNALSYVYPGTGMANTGGGGGGAASDGSSIGNQPVTQGAAGGSGLVLVRYALMQPCQSGAYSTGVYEATCSHCSAGTFALANSSTCSDCPKGLFSTATAASVCAECAKGSFSNASKSTGCLLCPANTYADIAAASECAQCPVCSSRATQLGGSCWSQGTDISCACNAGFFGLTGFVCSACPDGHYKSQMANAPECDACARGAYSAPFARATLDDCDLELTPSLHSRLNGVVAVGQACRTGRIHRTNYGRNEDLRVTLAPLQASQVTVAVTHMNTEDAFDFLIVGGTELSGSALMAATLGGSTWDIRFTSDESNEFSGWTLSYTVVSFVDTGYTACVSCSAGSFASSVNSTQCSQCSPGLFASGEGNSQCLGCAAGSYAALATSANCSLCPAGHFSNVTGPCLPCVAGSFASMQGSTKCADCKTCALYYAASSKQCAAGSVNDTVVCTCQRNYYGPGTTCSPCPANTVSDPGNTSSLLSCRCVAGYVCTYTKRIEATVHISNMSLADFTANYQDAFLAAIAKAAGVDISKVTIVVAKSGRRLLSRWSGASMAPQELTIKFYVHDATTLNPTLPALRRTLGFVFEIEWQHDHILHVKRSR